MGRDFLGIKYQDKIFTITKEGTGYYKYEVYRYDKNINSFPTLKESKEYIKYLKNKKSKVKIRRKIKQKNASSYKQK